jgi:hypothetical protein
MDIKLMHRQGYSLRQIARVTGLSRVTVRRILSSAAPKGYGPRRPRPSKLAPFVPQIRPVARQGHPARRPQSRRAERRRPCRCAGPLARGGDRCPRGAPHPRLAAPGRPAVRAHARHVRLRLPAQPRPRPGPRPRLAQVPRAQGERAAARPARRRQDAPRRGARHLRVPERHLGLLHHARHHDPPPCRCRPRRQARRQVCARSRPRASCSSSTRSATCRSRVPRPTTSSRSSRTATSAPA